MPRQPVRCFAWAT